MRGRSLIVVAALLGSASCEGACGKTHEATEKIGERLISVEMEERLGARMAAQVRREVRLVDDPVVQEYVDRLGRSLVASTTGVPAGMDFDFQVIDAPDTINAMAMPGGHIYVYSGLLRAVDSEAELAAVLAHEIAHVAERHVVAQLVTSLGIQALRAIALGEDTGRLGELAADLATGGALGAFSRTAEREADELGVATLVRAGWDPRGYVSFFDKLATRQGAPGLLARFAASHPDPAERAERARRMIEELEIVPTRRDDGTLDRIVARL